MILTTVVDETIIRPSTTVVSIYGAARTTTMRGLKEGSVNEVFRELPESKQREIINAAFGEFGEHGYKRASTNSIIKQAGISKGMLFYYFNTKQELFDDLVNIALDATLDRFQSLLAAEPSDYINWLYKISKEKLQYQYEHPELVRFLGNLFVSGDVKHLKPEVRERFEAVQVEAWRLSRRQMDTSVFRDDIPEDTIKDMIGWVVEGYQKQAVAKMTADAELWVDTNMDPIWEEFYGILAILKKLFYKESE